jgi:hypothetical protein
MSGQIFISYRREDASHPAGRLYDRLSAHFPQNQIVMDVDNIPPGIDFVEAIEQSVGSCDVLIAVMGKHWLATSDEQGRRRLDHPEDFVRLEVGTGLKRGIRVIPVLVDRTVMPRADNLPEDLKPLVRRNAVEISHDRFRADSERLITAVERALEDARVETQRKGEEQGRAEAEQRLRAEQEQLQAGERLEERLEALRREREENERREAGRPETEALGGIGADSRAPLSPQARLKGVSAKLEKPRRWLAVMGLGVVVCSLCVVVVIGLLGVGLFKATRPPPGSIGGSSSATPAPLAAASNAPSPSADEQIRAENEKAVQRLPSGGTPSAFATPSPSLNEQPAEAAVPPPPDGYAIDYANLLRPETLALLNTRLADYERQTSNQFLVAIFARLPPATDQEAFTREVFRAWKPGQANLNNGAILFVFVQERTGTPDLDPTR